METVLLSLLAKNDVIKLHDTVSKLNEDEMTTMVKNSAACNDQNFIKLVTALIKGLPTVPSSTPLSSSSTSEMTLSKRTLLFATAMETLVRCDLIEKVSTELVGLLLNESDDLPAWFLVRLSKDMTEYIRDTKIKNFRFLELLPKLVFLLKCQDHVPVDSGSMKGTDYKELFINSVCSAKWACDSVIHIASVCKELQLNAEELKVVITKCIKAMDFIDLQEVPPLVYQLLVLSSKGCKSLVLDGIINFFYEKNLLCGINKKIGNVTGTIIDEMDLIEDSSSSQAAASSQLKQVEGTVIYHVTFSIKQNQELGKEFIKYFKANQYYNSKRMLSPFVISLTLSISKINSFETQILDLLKQTVIYCFKDQTKKQDSKWMREISPAIFDVTNYIMEAIKRILVDWDTIMEGLVSFSFSLMEIPPTKHSFGKPAPTSAAINKPTPGQHLNILGAKILEQCSKVHGNVAMEIVNQLSNRIITKGSGYVSSYYIELLIGLIKFSPHSYIDNSQRFKDFFDYFPFLPIGTSKILLTAILPVARISPSLKNGLILFLKKSLFSRQIEMRKVAVEGFLLLLKNFRVLTGFNSSQSQSTSSQVSVDIHGGFRGDRSNTVDNKSLCLEILGSLRRSFGQQHDVRSLLYDGLFEVCATNLFLAGPIADLLLTHLKNYYDPNEDNLPPLKVTSCLSLNSDVLFVSEPLPDLVCNIVYCLRILKSGSSQDDEMQGFIRKADAILDSIATRMAKCDADDFELDKNSEFDTNAGNRNTYLASLVIGLFEVFMQRETFNFDPKAETIIKLFQCQGQIIDLVRDSEPNKKGKAKRHNVILDPQKSDPLSVGHHLSLNFVVKVTRLMFEQNNNIFLSNNDFCNYLFNSTTMLLQQVTSMATGEAEFHCHGYTVKDRDLFISDCFDIGRLLLKWYMKTVIMKKAVNSTNNNNDVPIAATANNNDIPSTSNNNNNKDRATASKQLNSYCLKIFHQVLLLFSKKFPDRLLEFLHNLDVLSRKGQTNSGKDLSSGLGLYIKIFQRVFITLLTSDGDSVSSRDRLIAMQCVSTLVDSCPGDCSEEILSKCHDWLIRLIQEHKIEDLELLKLVLKQLLTLTKSINPSLTFLNEVSGDIHICLGDVNDEKEFDKTNKFASIGRRSSTAVMQLVLSHLDRDIEDTNWMIAGLMSLLGASVSLSSTNDVEGVVDCSFEGAQKDSSSLSIKEINRSLIGRLSSMTDILHELVQTSIPFGPMIEFFLKILNRFYILLTYTVKLYIWKYNNKTKHVDIHVSGCFEKFIKHTATHLTPLVYPMITYIETVENEKLQEVNEKQKKNKNKNKDAPVEKIKKIKETKFVPTVVLSLEQYEKSLIQLSKKSKVDLMAYFKVSTSRDFRINNEALQAAFDRCDDDDCRNTDDDDDDDDDDDTGDDGEDEVLLLRKNETHNDGGASRKQNDDEADEGTSPPKKRQKLKDILPRNKLSAGRKVSKKSE